MDRDQQQEQKAPSELKLNDDNMNAPAQSVEVQKSVSSMEFTAIPDGGVIAWLQVLGSFCLWMSTLGIVTSFGMFQDYYQKNFLELYSPSDIAWIGTLQGFLLFGAGIFSGPLFDRGYLKALLISGTILITVGLMTASVARHYYSIFLSLGLCTGVGMSLLFTPSVAIIGTYFTSKRTLASGISAAGGGVGTVLFTVIFTPLVDSIGFGWAIRVIAFIVLASLLTAIAVLRQRLPTSKPRQLIDSAAFREARFNVFALALFLMFAGAYSPFFFVAVFGEEKLAISPRMANNMLAILGVGSVFGRILPSFAAKRYGALPTYAIVMLLCGLLQFIWGAVHNLGGLISFSFFYGFFGGSVAGLTPAVCMELSPNMHVVGTRIGMFLFLGSIGVLVGNPIAGVILEGRSSFGGVQAFSGGVLLAGSVLVVVAWELLQKHRKGAASSGA